MQKKSPEHGVLKSKYFICNFLFTYKHEDCTNIIIKGTTSCTSVTPVHEAGKPKLSDQPTLTEACSIVPRLIGESFQHHILVAKPPSHMAVNYSKSKLLGRVQNSE